MRSSAETRSRSRWSMTAMSPAVRRLTSSFVLRPSLVRPETSRAVACWSGGRAELVRATAMTAECRGCEPPLLRRPTQLLGVPASRHVVGGGAEHPDELPHHLALLEHGDR